MLVVFILLGMAWLLRYRNSHGEMTLQITDATVVDATDTEATDAPDYRHHPKLKPGTL